MKKMKSLRYVSVIASFIILMFLGTVYGIVDQKDQEPSVLNNSVNLDGNQYQLAPERQTDRPSYGIEPKSKGYKLIVQQAPPNKIPKIDIFILNTGDIHTAPGRLDKIKNFIDSVKTLRNKDRVILLDAGDMLAQYKDHTRTWAGEGQTERMFQWASTMGYDAMVFGNHDFIESVKVTQSTIDKYNLPFICANLDHPDLNASFKSYKGEGQTQYKIITREITPNGSPSKITVKIGVIGLADIGDPKHVTTPSNTDYHFPYRKNPDGTQDTTEKDNLKVNQVYNYYMTRTLIPEVKEKQADFIIFLSHNPDGVDKDPIVAKMLIIDKCVAIVGGHSHLVIPATLAQYAKVVKAGVHGAYIGSTRVRWNPNSKKVESVTGMNYDIDHNKYLEK